MNQTKKNFIRNSGLTSLGFLGLNQGTLAGFRMFTGEDGYGKLVNEMFFTASSAGRSYVIAQNIGYRESKFAGPVFSPSGKTLFVNIQTPGLTLAITGPWKNLNS